MKIGTLTTGDNVVTTIRLDYLPEAIHWAAGTALKGLTVEVLGDGVICNLDQAGLDALGRVENIGVVTNGRFVRLANGIFKKKNVTIKITNSAAQTPDIYAYSKQEGQVYVSSQSTTLNQNSPVTVSDFMVAAFPGGGDTDKFTVVYSAPLPEKRVVEQLDLADIRAQLALQQRINNSASDYVFNNFSGLYSEIKFIPASGSQTVYEQKIVLPSK